MGSPEQRDDMHPISSARREVLPLQASVDDGASTGGSIYRGPSPADSPAKAGADGHNVFAEFAQAVLAENVDIVANALDGTDLRPLTRSRPRSRPHSLSPGETSMLSEYPYRSLRTHNVAPREYVLPIDPSIDAPAAARRFIADHARLLDVELLHDAVLIASELVTNAIRYGSPEIMLRMHTGPVGLGIAVEDAGAEMPQLIRRPSLSLEHGRGLVLIDALAAAWGVTPSEPPPGKTVWCELGTAT
jgi:anti-sigma regulatory factor (Ser/Thr protein kinase)